MDTPELSVLEALSGVSGSISIVAWIFALVRFQFFDEASSQSLIRSNRFLS